MSSRKEINLNIALLILLLFPFALPAQSYVTYQLSGGRFGDQLSNYLHGKWASYKTGLPLLFVPFEFSDELNVSILEQFSDLEIQPLNQRIICGNNHQLENIQDNTLYYVPHFTTFPSDGVYRNYYYGVYNLIDWRDRGFLELVRSAITPKWKKSSLSLNQGTEEIAIHFREGGNWDPNDDKPNYPLRFLPFEWYLGALSSFVHYLPSKPLKITLFTDALEGEYYRTRIENYLLEKHPSIESEVVLSLDGILQDFFSLIGFKYMIAPESLFSYNAAKIGNCQLLIKPQLFGTDLHLKPIIFQSAQDLSYKTKAPSETLRFDAHSGHFEKDLEDILKRVWYAHKNHLCCDITLNHSMYRELYRTFLNPLSPEGTFLFPNETSLSEIDWNDSVFCSLVREIWSPKFSFEQRIEKSYPSIALYYSPECISKYLELRAKEGWGHHHVTVFIPHSLDRKNFVAFGKKLVKELKTKACDLHLMSLTEDPLKAFASVGCHTLSISPPMFLMETAGELFCPRKPIVVN